MVLKKTTMKDLNGKKMESGHIAAVRYVYNSYVGVISPRGLLATGAKRHAFFSPHSLDEKATYQIIGHIHLDHADYNQEVLDWYKAEEGNCPVKLDIYKNISKT